MNLIESRIYRERMGEGRFISFTSGYKDTDLWIGIDQSCFSKEIEPFTFERIKHYRKELEDYLMEDPLFGMALKPYPAKQNAPKIAKIMAQAATLASVGPMAAVAGAFSEFIGRDIFNQFKPEELVVENGGDLFLINKKPIVLSVDAGQSPLSGKVGIEIPPTNGIGVCTSSGTVGPSLSFGKADAAMIACQNTALADAWATALGNRIQNPDDIASTITYSQQIKEILSVVIVCEDKLGIQGIYNLKLIND